MIFHKERFNLNWNAFRRYEIAFPSCVSTTCLFTLFTVHFNLTKAPPPPSNACDPTNSSREIVLNEVHLIRALMYEQMRVKWRAKLRYSCLPYLSANARKLQIKDSHLFPLIIFCHQYLNKCASVLMRFPFKPNFTNYEDLNLCPTLSHQLLEMLNVILQSKYSWSTQDFTNTKCVAIKVHSCHTYSLWIIIYVTIPNIRTSIIPKGFQQRW